MKSRPSVHTIMLRVMVTLFTIHSSLFTASAQDTFNQIDEMGNVTQRSQNFNKHNSDSTSSNKVG